MIKKIIPVSENKNISLLIDEILKSKKLALIEKKPVKFYLDLDNSLSWQEILSEKKEEEEIKKTEIPLTFISAKNSKEEKYSGKISFTFFPDGTEEFGIIIFSDPETRETFSIFFNPYFSPEFMKGEINFEEKYRF